MNLAGSKNTLSQGQQELEVLVSRNFPAFSVSLSYASNPLRSAYQALHGLLATIERCFYGTSDNQVTLAKLGWWWQELISANSGKATHPLSIWLKSSGALDSWNESLLSRLFDLAGKRADPVGLNTGTELNMLCESMGMCHFELECAIARQVMPVTDSTRFLAVNNGLVQLMRESFWSNHAEFSWVPLSVCAQLAIDRKEIIEHSTIEADQDWLSVVVETTRPHQSSMEICAAINKELPLSRRQEILHWLIFSLLQSRQLNRMIKSARRNGSVRLVPRQLSELNFSDVWNAWRLARQLR